MKKIILVLVSVGVLILTSGCDKAPDKQQVTKMESMGSGKSQYTPGGKNLGGL